MTISSLAISGLIVAAVGSAAVGSRWLTPDSTFDGNTPVSAKAVLGACSADWQSMAVGSAAVPPSYEGLVCGGYAQMGNVQQAGWSGLGQAFRR